MARKSRERWEVEWTTDVKVNEFGDSDPDSGTENVRYFEHEDDAVKFAESVVGADYWGCPRVTLQRLNVWNPHDGGPMLQDLETVRTVEVC